MDRRVARTRAALQAAFRALIVRDGYDAVTVQQICASAGVSRATFYAHYKGKADLKRRSILSLKHTLGEAASAHEPPFGFSQALFDHAEAHRDQHDALLGSRGHRIVHESLRDVVRHLTREDLRRRALAASPEAVAYHAEALLGLLLWWLEDGAPPAAAEMETRFRRLLAGDGRKTKENYAQS